MEECQFVQKELKVLVGSMTYLLEKNSVKVPTERSRECMPKHFRDGRGPSGVAGLGTLME